MPEQYRRVLTPERCFPELSGEHLRFVRHHLAGSFLGPANPCYHEISPITGEQALKRLEGKRLLVADTKKIEDKLERKKVKRAARKKATPKAKRTTPRGSKKRKVKKLVRGQSKR